MRLLVFILFLFVIVTGCTNKPANTDTPNTNHANPYPDLGQAPELTNEVWINSAPLRLADLRGKVVLLDMWTFG